MCRSKSTHPMVEEATIHTQWAVSITQTHHVTLTINYKADVSFHMDTGSSVDIRPYQDYLFATADHSCSKLEKTNIRLVMHNKSLAKPIGLARLKVHRKGTERQMRSVVVRTNIVPHLSLQSCLELLLIQINDCDAIHAITVRTDRTVTEAQKAYTGRRRQCRNYQSLIKLVHQKQTRSALQCRASDHKCCRMAHCSKDKESSLPRDMRAMLTKKLHSSHLGVEGYLRRARQVTYWPGMNHDVKDVISACCTCNAYEPEQCREPLLSHDSPSRPWSRLTRWSISVPPPWPELSQRCTTFRTSSNLASCQ